MRLLARLHRQAFTLIELLIAIAIIGILAALTIVAINPNKQLADAEDAKRRSHLKVILDGVYQYQIDTWEMPRYDNGVESIIVSVPRYICSHSDSATCRFLSHAYLHNLSGTYLVHLPSDPDNTDQYHTGYQIWRDADGHITVRAPLGDNGNGITLTR